MTPTGPSPELTDAAIERTRTVQVALAEIRQLAPRFATAVEHVGTVAYYSVCDGPNLAAWESRLTEAADLLDELTSTAGTALTQAGAALSSLRDLIEADEDRRAAEAAAQARRARFEAEVQRLAAEEDDREATARRERLEAEAERRLAGAKGP